MIVRYILNVYIPTLLEVKKKCNIVNGSRNLFNLLKRGREFFNGDKERKDIFMRYVARRGNKSKKTNNLCTQHVLNIF